MHLFNGEFFRLLLALVGWVMATLMVELDWNHHHNCNYQMPGFKITRGRHTVKTLTQLEDQPRGREVECAGVEEDDEWEG